MSSWYFSPVSKPTFYFFGKTTLIVVARVFIVETIKNGLLGLGTMILNGLSGIVPKAMEKLTSLLETGVQWMNSPSSITGKLGLGKSSSAFLGAFVNLFNINFFIIGIGF